jgi:hypothetical protein
MCCMMARLLRSFDGRYQGHRGLASSGDGAAGRGPGSAERDGRPVTRERYPATAAANRAR